MLTVQRKHDGHWLKVASFRRTIGTSGAYSRTYRPTKRRSYRMRATFAMTATNTSARTTWRTFKVR